MLLTLVCVHLRQKSPTSSVTYFAIFSFYFSGYLLQVLLDLFI